MLQPTTINDRNQLMENFIVSNPVKYKQLKKQIPYGPMSNNRFVRDQRFAYQEGRKKRYVKFLQNQLQTYCSLEETEKTRQSASYFEKRFEQLGLSNKLEQIKQHFEEKELKEKKSSPYVIKALEEMGVQEEAKAKEEVNEEKDYLHYTTKKISASSQDIVSSFNFIPLSALSAHSPLSPLSDLSALSAHSPLSPLSSYLEYTDGAANQVQDMKASTFFPAQTTKFDGDDVRKTEIEDVEVIEFDLKEIHSTKTQHEQESINYPLEEKVKKEEVKPKVKKEKVKTKVTKQNSQQTQKKRKPRQSGKSFLLNQTPLANDRDCGNTYACLLSNSLFSGESISIPTKYSISQIDGPLLQSDEDTLSEISYGITRSDYASSPHKENLAPFELDPDNEDNSDDLTLPPSWLPVSPTSLLKRQRDNEEEQHHTKSPRMCEENWLDLYLEPET